jgi:hypothetical protein
MWNIHYIIKGQLLEVYIFLYPAEYLKILDQIFRTICGIFFLAHFLLSLQPYIVSDLDIFNSFRSKFLDKFSVFSLAFLSCCFDDEHSIMNSNNSHVSYYADVVIANSAFLLHAVVLCSGTFRCIAVTVFHGFKFQAHSSLSYE